MSDDSEKIRLTGEYWKQIIAVQMHFNDLCIRTRWLLLTVVSTIIAASFIVFKENDLKFELFIIKLNLKFHVSMLLVLIAIGISFVLRWLDKKYYYKLLLCSVDYGEKFERESNFLCIIFPESGSLNHYISSQVSRKESKFAVRVFYNSIIGALFFIFFVMMWIINK